MKKYHDQVLRNIYKLVVPDDDGVYNDPDIHAELLTSAALPAHCYVAGFKNFSHLRDVIVNQQNITTRDLQIIANELYKALTKRSYKQHNMPLDFYEHVIQTINAFAIILDFGNLNEAKLTLEDAINWMIRHYGHEKQYAAMRAYEVEHPMPKRKDGYDYYDQDCKDTDYVEYWKKYFAFQKTVRFGAYWNYRVIFEQILVQLIYITY